MDEEIASITFNEGCVIERDYVYVASKIDSLDPAEYDYSRMHVYDKPNWFHHDLEWDVLSVCVSRKEDKRKCVAMSMQGDIAFQFVGGSEVESIPNAGTLNGRGAMSQVREIGDKLVACGYEGQVYVRQPSGWQVLSDGLISFSSKDQPAHLNSIDGNQFEDIYAVGYFGRIFHFDGKKWSEIESPTNVHLERVRVENGIAYICGNNGTVLFGNKDGFELVSIDNHDNHLWGLERYKGKTYVADLDGVYVHDGINWAPVKMGLKGSVDAYRLDAYDGVMWSFGPKTIAQFDGSKWTRVAHPDNDE
jgi:hypothetical protein